MSDEQWALVEPVIVAWKAAHPSVSGYQGRYAMREIVNALLYQGRTGCRVAGRSVDRVSGGASFRHVQAVGVVHSVDRGSGGIRALADHGLEFEAIAADLLPDRKGGQ